ncbi:hypothetical protein DAEQUDRAFT_748928 [Daedalea quercina L-15889]|uniref:Uncharacterized protein n=1 Tax=Daedalea quercina L-15889 TaxID=1314783 RepID=A0A165TFL2_9APHY|nr:hypothetical protein DAEQUDRAFT_748928 [Daedalea quercina L-15889]
MSSLSSVVSNLVRAQMGTSLAPTVTDEDLDRHVAELILKEAKQKAEKYGQDGIKAYLRSNDNDSNAPKANKRFLSSIIKSTDDHNKTILRAQAQAAEEIRLEREEQERRERRARAEEAVAAERMRRLMGQGGRTEWASNWDRGGSRDRKRRERSWEKPASYEDTERERKRERRSDRYERERRHRHRPRSGERRSQREDSHKPRRSRSRDRYDEVNEDEYERRRRRHHKERSRSRPNARSEDASDDRDHDKRSRRHRDETGSLHKDRLASPSERTNVRPHTPDDDRPSRSRRHSPSTARSDDSPRPRSLQSHDSTEEAGETLSREEELRLELKRKGKARATDNSADCQTRRSSPSRQSSVARDTKSRTHNAGSTRPGSASSHTLRSSASPARTSPGPPSPPTFSPPPLPPLPSKMDKYFESSYDPRLDVAPLAAPNVPKTGLIDDADFAGWDAMLEVIRQRREYKAEKKVLERWGIGKDKDKAKKGVEAALWSEGGSSIMDIQYKKKGSVREWDLGKEGF